VTTSLLRGLRALEILGTEALGVSEVARRLGVDKAGVSRMLTQLHAEGWLLRTGSRYVLGERALGMSGTDLSEVRRRAGRLVAELHERTALTAVVVRLAGDGAQPVAVRGTADFLEPEAPYDHLWVTAGGLALLAQLPDAELERRMDVDPWPTASPAAPGDAAAVRSVVRRIRGGAPAEERSWTIAGAGCIALPWPIPQPGPPHAALVVGAATLVERDAVELRRALRECVEGF
jgi:DNA-binding IclR family transcriptional regulator